MLTTVLEHAIPVLAALAGGIVLGRKLRGRSAGNGDDFRR